MEQRAATPQFPLGLLLLLCDVASACANGLVWLIFLLRSTFIRATSMAVARLSTKTREGSKKHGAVGGYPDQPEEI